MTAEDTTHVEQQAETSTHVETTSAHSDTSEHATQVEASSAHTDTTEHTEDVAHEEEALIHVSLKPEVLFNIGPIPVTNSLWVAYLTSFIIIVVFAFVARNLKAVPGKLQLFVETIFMTLYNLVHGVTKNEKVTKSVYPVFVTTALFLLACNLFGQIPGLMALEFHTASGHEVHLFRPVTADYAAVLGITGFMFVFWQLTVVRFIGAGAFIKKFFNFSGVIEFGIGILEILGEIAKIISLSFRLFGNIFSEEVLILVMLAIAPVLGPLPFSMLGLLTSVIQAILFPILILLFMNMSIAEHAEGHH